MGDHVRPYAGPLSYVPHKEIGITDLNESNVYLYKNNGELVKGFPIKGNSIIDIRDSDNDNKIEILTRLDEFSVASYEIN